MNAKRKTLAFLLVACICLLSACAKTQFLSAEEMGIPPKALSPSLNTASDSTVSSTIPDASAEQLIPNCKTHQYGPWEEPERMYDGTWIQTHRCSVCGYSEFRPCDPPADYSHLGSATTLTEKTVIVSIFANDSTTSWDFGLKADQDMANTMHKHLGNAVKWISKQCKPYGVTVEFVYDWKEHTDLYFTHDFGSTTLVRADGGGYRTQEDYIKDYIDSEALMEQFEAENILYVFYFNTGKSNTVNSWSISDQCDEYTEIINVFVRDDCDGGVYIMPASSFAHEILHCFGAVDLYYASAEIPQEYVDHLRKTRSRDIMYTVSLGSSIPQKFSELDAYYVGLTDSCELVETWGLAQSRHILYAED